MNLACALGSFTHHLLANRERPSMHVLGLADNLQVVQQLPQNDYHSAVTVKIFEYIFF